jgi:hypothetical protein
VAYEVNLRACRRALVSAQAEGRIATLEDLAKQAHLSRDTVRRFLYGQRSSLRSALRILIVLRLRFDEVVTEVED